MAITSNNVQNVKFLRNGSLFATREAARTALNGFGLTYEKDGTAILARYGSNDDVKTLVGWVYANNSGNKSITIFDIDDAETDAKAYVDSLVGTGITSANTATAQLEALSGNNGSTSAQTSVEGAKRYADEKVRAAIDGLDVAAITAPAGAFIKGVSQADGKVSATTEDMPTVAIQTATGKPIIAVSQTKGTLAASAGTIDAQYVNISDSGSLIAATDVEGALAEIATEIDAMDLTQVGDGNGKVIIAVSEQDGKVSASATSVSDLTLEGFEANAATTGAVTSADTIEAAINKLENKAAAITIDNDDHSINVTTAASGTNIAVNIKSGENVIKLGNDGIYTDIKLSGITPSSTNVREEYALIASDGTTQLGSSIKVYKDSSLTNIFIGHVDDTLTHADTQGESPDTDITNGTGDTALVYIMHLEDDKYKLAAVNVESFLEENEFGSGVTATNHVVHGVVDSASEKDSNDSSFLSVGADGFKIDGIKNEITAKINALDAVVTGGTTAGTATSNHIQVIVGEADGKLTGVTVTETNIANASDLDTLSGKTVTAVEMTGGTAAIAANSTDGTKKITINADGASLKMTGYSKGSASGAVEATDSVNAAIGKLENQIAGNIDALDADVSGNTTHVTVGVKEVDGKITAVTVAESNIANASDLTSEIAARKAVDGVAGDAYTADTNANYISATTSLYGADQALDAALKAEETRAKAAEAAAKSVVAAGSTAASSSNAVVVTPTTDGTDSHIIYTIQLGTIDCGTY